MFNIFWDETFELRDTTSPSCVHFIHLYNECMQTESRQNLDLVMRRIYRLTLKYVINFFHEQCNNQEEITSSSFQGPSEHVQHNTTLFSTTQHCSVQHTGEKSTYLLAHSLACYLTPSECQMLVLMSNFEWMAEWTVVYAEYGLRAAIHRLVIDHISDNRDLSTGLYHLGFDINLSKDHRWSDWEQNAEENIWSTKKTT